MKRTPNETVQQTLTMGYYIIQYYTILSTTVYTYNAGLVTGEKHWEGECGEGRENPHENSNNEKDILM